MDVEQDLRVLDEQEQRLRFRSFNADTAWRLGSALRQQVLARNAGCSMEIELAGQLVLACVTVGAGLAVANPGQANWIRRKRNTVRHFARSTYAVGRKLEREGGTLQSKHGLAEADFVAHGGGFPLLLEGTGMVGSVVLSGLPQREDHNMVVEALAEVLGVEVPRLP